MPFAKLGTYVCLSTNCVITTDSLVHDVKWRVKVRFPIVKTRQVRYSTIQTDWRKPKPKKTRKENGRPSHL